MLSTTSAEPVPDPLTISIHGAVVEADHEQLLDVLTAIRSMRP